MARLHGARVPGFRMDSADPRHDRVRLRRHSVPARRGRRTARPHARDDDADLARDPGRVRDELGEHARLARRRDLVGARHPHHDHAARPLARDALDRPGPRGARRARRAAPRHRRAGDRRRDRDGRGCGCARRGRGARAARWPHPGRRRGHRRRRGRRRVTDHRRVSSGPQGTGRRGDRRIGGRRRVAPGQRHGCRRPDDAVGDRASGRVGPGLAVACPGTRRSRGRAPVLRGTRRRRGHVRRVDAARRSRRCRHPLRDRARDRLPARARSRDPARRRDLDGARCPERAPREGPHRARARPRRRHGDLRQDRDAYPGGAGACRGRGD